jgi:5-methylcytosine-specific restriction endonuclease McrA
MTRNTTLRDRYRRSIARTKPPCHICGQPINYQAGHLDPLAFTIDHVIPLNKGGTDTVDNCAAAHRMCNRTKSDTLPDQGGPLYITTRTW